ncbi:MAG: peptide chain release factor N(5)-glutamine methyltransferase, partial [Woeseiaceae bacterium]
VNPDVLIPRPETEILVETILHHLKNEGDKIILDIGCGSGNISIALAVNNPSLKIYSTDSSEGALNVSKRNAEKNSVLDKIEFIHHNILTEDLNQFPELDVIVSNPPYVSSDEFSSLQKEIRDFEPRKAVTDDADGYTFFKVISAKSFSKLREGGKLFFEMAQGQSREVVEIMITHNYKNIEIIKDYQKIDRISIGER